MTLLSAAAADNRTRRGRSRFCLFQIIPSLVNRANRKNDEQRTFDSYRIDSLLVGTYIHLANGQQLNPCSYVLVTELYNLSYTPK